MSRQPFLHDLVPLIAAPFQVWSQADGDVENLEVQGFFLGDTRVLSRAVLTVWGEQGPVEKPAIATSERGNEVSFEYALRLPGPVAEPLVQLTRTRTVTIGGVNEMITLSSSLEQAIELTVRIRLTPDGTPLNLIKAGEPATPDLRREGRSWRWNGHGTTASLQLGEADVIDDGHSLTASWVLRAAPGQPQSASWSLGAADDALPFVGV
ncbi:MAG: glycogen debranching N-terminal domain-containing protein, partial [Micropruina sp.]